MLMCHLFLCHVIGWNTVIPLLDNFFRDTQKWLLKGGSCCTNVKNS